MLRALSGIVIGGFCPRVFRRIIFQGGFERKSSGAENEYGLLSHSLRALLLLLPADYTPRIDFAERLADRTRSVEERREIRRYG